MVTYTCVTMGQLELVLNEIRIRSTTEDLDVLFRHDGSWSVIVTIRDANEKSGDAT